MIKERIFGTYSIIFLALTVFGIIYRITWITGIPDIVGGPLGCAVVLGIAFLSKGTVDFKSTKKKMTVSTFFCMLGLLCFGQLLATPLYNGFELILNQLGLTMYAPEAEAAFAGSDGSSLFTLELLYPLLFAPILEEIMYRAYAGKTLEKSGGKLFAILISAVAFSLGHGRFSLFAHTLVGGMIFCYLLLEYGFKWACIFHVINNFVLNSLSIVMLIVFDNGDLALIIFQGLFTLLALLICFRKKDVIIPWFQEARSEMRTKAAGKFNLAFGNLGFLVFLGFALFKACTAIVGL